MCHQLPLEFIDRITDYKRHMFLLIINVLSHLVAWLRLLERNKYPGRNLRQYGTWIHEVIWHITSTLYENTIINHNCTVCTVTH